MSDSPSSAELLVIEISKAGIAVDDIRDFHLRGVYDNLVNRNGRNIPDFQYLNSISLASSTIDNDDPLWGVIVETRQHPFLVGVIIDFIETLGINVHLFHGPSCTNFIKSTELRQYADDGRLVLTDIGVDSLDARQYNALLLNHEFWKSIPGDTKVLVFQTDSVLCKNSIFSIYDFMSYDYIGSMWNRLRPNGLIIDGGNGGFSLRDKKMLLSCLDRFPPQKWRGGEDGYFAFHLDLIGANIARGEECAKFSTQHSFLYPSFGAHNVSKCLSALQRNKFLNYCPEASNI